MRKYTYIKICKKCGGEILTNNPSQQLHVGCRAKYPKRSKEFSQRRIDVLIRDNQVCQHCGFDFKGGGQSIKKHVHHIDKDPKNNNINNLVVLCAGCHQLAHHNDLVFKFKKDFKPKKYKEKTNKTEKFYFKNIG
jgi:5-methylcytosine-specific restriction endonuclease McrA